MLLGPIPDRLGLLAIRGRATAATATPRTADLAARLDKGLQGVAQLLGMRSAEVDLVFRPVDAEPNGLFRFRAVKVVYDLNDGLAGHYCAFPAGIPDELEAYRCYVRKQAFLVEWLAMTYLERHNVVYKPGSLYVKKLPGRTCQKGSSEPSCTDRLTETDRVKPLPASPVKTVNEMR